MHQLGLNAIPDQLKMLVDTLTKKQQREFRDRLLVIDGTVPSEFRVAHRFVLEKGYFLVSSMSLTCLTRHTGDEVDRLDSSVPPAFFASLHGLVGRANFECLQLLTEVTALTFSRL